jgi:prevent-host-death family protein
VRTIPAGQFKARCLKLLDEVAENGETIVVTKRGRPVAKVGPVEDPPSLEGSVTFLVSDEELMEPILGPWDVERG